MSSTIFAHLIMLLFAAGVATLGWFMAHNPAKTLHFFLFGQEPAFGKNLGIVFCKACGWFFCASMSAGVAFYAVLITVDIVHRN